MSGLFSLQGKTAFITGSSRGLGFVLAKGLAEHGARVILNGINIEILEDARQRLTDMGLNCAAQAFDLCSASDTEQSLNDLWSQEGRIDILLNNAGINLRGALTELSQQDWDKVLDVNLTASWRVARTLARKMIEDGHGGKIVNICSLMSFAGRPSTGAYTASKGGLALLTKAMAVEWTKYNIQCNAIGPGYFITDMTRPLQANEQFNGWVRMRTPAERWGQPEELIGPVVMLASAASSFISGQILYVDGGWTSNL